KGGVNECKGWQVDRIEVAVEHVDGAGVEVRGVEKVAGHCARDREALVHRATRRVVHGDQHDTRPKSGDGAVLAGEDEDGSAPTYEKAGGVTVPHETGRRALLAPRAWNRDNQRAAAG